MMTQDKLAYFFTEAELRGVFADWPEEIGLVLCLDDAGGCDMLLHHITDGAAVLDRAAAVLGRALGEFAVAPAMPDLPTRRVLFSDEQSLLTLVAAETDLPELAADHLINFRFEQERKAKALSAAGAKAAEKGGVRKPTAKLGGKAGGDTGIDKGAKAAVKAGTVPRMPPLGAPALPPRAATLAAADPVEAFLRRAPRFRLSEVRANLPGDRAAARAGDLPVGYRPASEIRHEECRFAEGALTLGARGVRLTIGAERVSVQSRPLRVAEIGFRDDFSRFVLPRSAIGAWESGDPLVIDMPVELFPAGLQQRFALAARRAEVTVTRRGVFVAPGAPVAPVVPSAQDGLDGTVSPSVPPSEPPGPPPNRSRVPRFIAAALALVALTGLGMFAGSLLTERGVRAPWLSSWTGVPADGVAGTDGAAEKSPRLARIFERAAR
ncbi:hypothetical protein [Brevirhabdus sp.]|uniref:hypothetical protein n=1 Tax=Brevirhabdus sp. TaxID=2004514 RepID=UPI0040595907